MFRLLCATLSVALAAGIASCGSGVRPTPTPAPTIPPRTAEPTASATAAKPMAAAKTAVFVIVPGETSASYSIDEALLNEDGRLVTVVGKTTRVEGEFVLNAGSYP